MDSSHRLLQNDYLEFQPRFANFVSYCQELLIQRTPLYAQTADEASHPQVRFIF